MVVRRQCLDAAKSRKQGIGDVLVKARVDALDFGHDVLHRNERVGFDDEVVGDADAVEGALGVEAGSIAVQEEGSSGARLESLAQ